MKKAILLLIVLNIFRFSNAQDKHYREIFLTEGCDSTLRNAINLLNDSGVVKILGEIRINKKITIPSTISLEFEKGGCFYLLDTLDVYGHVSSALYHIFKGEGFVKLKNNTELSKVYPEWWGAKTDDSLDDASAIQRCIESGQKYIYFSKGEYIVRVPIIVESEGVNLIGDVSKSNIFFQPQNSSQVCFHYKIPKDCKIVNIKFSTLENIEDSHTCIKLHCDEDYAAEDPYWANIDGIIKSCTFSGFHICIEAYGRNLKVLNSTFSSYNYGISLNYDENFKEPSGDRNEAYYEYHLTGFRGFVISGNRFHAGKKASILSIGYNSENLYGCTITNNVHDCNASFFSGSISESIFSDNLIHRVYLYPALNFKYANNLIISNNFIGGEKNKHEMKRTTNSFPVIAEYGILFEERPVSVNISGNNLFNIKYDAILFKKLGSNISITNNIITKFGLGASTTLHGQASLYYGRNINGYAAIMIAFSPECENNPFMFTVVNNNIILGQNQNHGIWTRKKLDSSIISPNVFNITISTENKKRYFYDY